METENLLFQSHRLHNRISLYGKLMSVWTWNQNFCSQTYNSFLTINDIYPFETSPSHLYYLWWVVLSM